jgi:hypothetical protein
MRPEPMSELSLSGELKSMDIRKPPPGWLAGAESAVESGPGGSQETGVAMSGADANKRIAPAHASGHAGKYLRRSIARCDNCSSPWSSQTFGSRSGATL